MRTIQVMFAIFLFTATSVAQVHGRGWGFVCAARNPTLLGFYQPGGAITPLLPGSPLGVLSLGRAAMDFDNVGVVSVYTDFRNDTGLLRLDASGQVRKIVISSSLLTGPRPQDVEVNPNGNYDVLSATVGAPPGILEVDRSGQLRTVVSSAVFTFPTSFRREVETGDFIVLDRVYQAHLLRVSPDGSSIRTIATVKSGIIGPSDIAIDPRNGDVYYTLNNALLRITSKGAVSTVASGAIGVSGALFTDRSSAQRPRFVGSALNAMAFYTYDFTSQAVTTIVSGPAVRGVGGLFPYQGRNISTVQRGPRRWDVTFSFPGEASKAYAAAIGVSGTRPGFRLGPRRVALNPDVLTFASAAGGLSPVLSGMSGRLGGRGRATARLDVTGVPGLAGLRVHVIALVLDPAAPLGVSVIADPALIIL